MDSYDYSKNNNIKIDNNLTEVPKSIENIDSYNDDVDSKLVELYHLNKILEDELKPKYPPYDGPKWPSMCDPDDEAIAKWKAAGGGQPLPKDWDKINRIKEKIKHLELQIRPKIHLKYSENYVVFSEFPDEITLGFNITNCPHRCDGCHSPWLQKDEGKQITNDVIDESIEKTGNNITCIGFFGGDSNVEELNSLANHIKTKYNNSIKVGWYSGNDELDENINIKFFDYIKIGHYDKEKGPLNKKSTNQILYKVDKDGNLINITNRFWHNEI